MNTALAILGVATALAGLFLYIYIAEFSSRYTAPRHKLRVLVAALLMLAGTLLAVLAIAEQFAVHPAWGA